MSHSEKQIEYMSKQIVKLKSELEQKEKDFLNLQLEMGRDRETIRGLEQDVEMYKRQSGLKNGLETINP